MRWIGITIGDLLDWLFLEDGSKFNRVLIVAIIFNIITFALLFWALWSLYLLGAAR